MERPPRHSARLSAARAPAAAVALLALAALTVLALPALVGSAHTATDQTFADVPPDHPYHAAIEGMHAAGVVDGYPQDDGTVLFKPGNPVWRAQLVKMLAATMALPVDEGMTSPFDDLGVDDATLYPHEYVAAAAAAGITNGVTATSFAPYRNVSRAQAVTMIVRAVTALMPATLEAPPRGYHSVLGAFDATHSPNMDLASFNGLLDGVEGLGADWDPFADAGRGEVAQMMWNAKERGRVLPRVADLRPGTVRYALSMTLEGHVTATGAPGEEPFLDETTLTAATTVEILGATDGIADLTIAFDDIRIDGLPAGIDPVRLAFGLDERGGITYLTSQDGPLTLEESLRKTALTTFAFACFLAPLQTRLAVPGDRWSGSLAYPFDESRSGVSSETWVRLEGVADEGGRRIASLEYRNDLALEFPTELDLTDPPAGQALLPADPGAPVLVLDLSGVAAKEGSVRIDTRTGLPVSADALVDIALHLDAPAVQTGAPEAYARLAGMGTLSVTLTGTALLEEAP